MENVLNLTLELNKIYLGDALGTLKMLPAESVDCVVTSPPYWALRDYGTGEWIGGDKNCKHYRDNKSKNANTGQKREGANSGDGIYKTTCLKCGAIRVDKQLGLEPTFQEYITKICDIFDEIKRILKGTGSCWVNIGDTYYGGGRNRGGDFEDMSVKQRSNRGTRGIDATTSFKWGDELESKSLCNIPARFSIEMQNRGWILRNDIIWSKPNPMPESVRDRCTKSHEYIYFFAKNQKYYFNQDAIREPLSEIYLKEKRPFGVLRQRLYVNSKYQKEEYGSQQFKNNYGGGGSGFKGHSGYKSADGRLLINPLGRNKWTVWTIPTASLKEAHFATFPETLIEPMIKAGCPQGGVCLDPFMGSGTTALVAKSLSRNFVGIELNPKYIEIAEKRLKDAFGMFR